MGVGGPLKYVTGVCVYVCMCVEGIPIICIGYVCMTDVYTDVYILASTPPLHTHTLDEETGTNTE